MLNRLQLDDIQIPYLDGVGGAAGCLRNLLRSRTAWKSLEEIVKNRGENHGYIASGIVLSSIIL